MPGKSPKFNLDAEALKLVLNLALSNIIDDRDRAIEHHDTLAGLFNDSVIADGITPLEIQIMVQNLASSLTSFLNNTSKSTDSIIKLAKILSDHLKNHASDMDEEITDEERDLLLEDVVERAQMEKNKIVKMQERGN
jgi:hypothetical protein